MSRFRDAIHYMPDDQVIYCITHPKTRCVVYIGKGDHVFRAAAQASQDYRGYPVGYIYVSGYLGREFSMPNAMPADYDFLGNLERLLQALCIWHGGAKPEDMRIQNDGDQVGGVISSLAMFGAVNELLADFGVSSNKGLPPVPADFEQILRPARTPGPGAPQTRDAFPAFWVDLSKNEAHFDYCPMILTGKNYAVQYAQPRNHAKKCDWTF